MYILCTNWQFRGHLFVNRTFYGSVTCISMLINLALEQIRFRKSAHYHNGIKRYYVCIYLHQNFFALSMSGFLVCRKAFYIFERFYKTVVDYNESRAICFHYLAASNTYVTSHTCAARAREMQKILKVQERGQETAYHRT